MAAAMKSARINVRLKEADSQLIRRAAEAAGQSVTEFISSTALERAHEVLADQHEFVLDADRWDAFVAALDRPARPDPRLVELFSRPSRLD
jgi:uncharacterized protein (DUF1778 family)